MNNSGIILFSKKENEAISMQQESIVSSRNRDVIDYPSPGSVIAILMMPSSSPSSSTTPSNVESDTMNDEQKKKFKEDQNGKIYICKVGNTKYMRDNDSNSITNWKQQFLLSNQSVMIRFSTTVELSLRRIGQQNPVEISILKNQEETIKELISNLEDSLENIKAKPVFYINNSSTSKLDDNVMSTQDQTLNCIGMPVEENKLRPIKGVVLSLLHSSGGGDDDGDGVSSIIDEEHHNMKQERIIPTPLLSLTLCESGNDSNKDLNTSVQLALLHQCLKRQIVGNIIVGVRDDDTDDSKNCHRHLCRISLSIPGKGGKQCHCFEVAEYRSFQKTIGSPRKNAALSPPLFVVLPSTRITIISRNEYNDETQQTGDEEKRDEDQDISEEEEPIIGGSNAQDLLFNTIRDIGIFARKVNERCMSTLSNGFDVPRAFLLSGPPGVGKTYAVRIAVQRSNTQHESDEHTAAVRMTSIRGSELLSTGATEAEAAIELKRIFDAALKYNSMRQMNISVLFMDECDALLSSPVVASTLALLLDQMSQSSIGVDKSFTSLPSQRRILIIAATNRIDSIPAMLRRPGRFDKEICIGPPSSKARYKILKNLLQQLQESEIDSKHNFQSDINITKSAYDDQQGLSRVADSCVGYVPADLAALVRRAAYLGIESGIPIVTADLLTKAMNDIGASALRESAVNAPPMTTWEDIAGDAGGAKTALQRAIEWPQKKKEEFSRLGLVPPRGILLYGPPGCAKTTLARAAAGSAQVAFLSLSPADVYASSYVGEAEAVVRRAFALARSASPCILFFDEIDSVVGTSSGGAGDHGMDRGTTAEARVLSTFLNEMDGVDGSRSDGVLILGATNRPSTMDAALLRPGRFDKVIYVPPPDRVSRCTIFESQIARWKRNISKTSSIEAVDDSLDSIDINHLSCDSVSGSMTGAEIVGACQEAAMLALRESMAKTNESVAPIITQHHLEKALHAVKPLLSDSKILLEYSKFQDENKVK